MQVIIPCGGKSSRYPTARPKFLLTMPDGRPMFMHAADVYYSHLPITFAIVQQHVEQYDAEYAIKHAYGNTVSIKILDDVTSGPAETVYKVLQDWSTDCAFISNDCDGFLKYTIPNGENFVAVIDLHDYPLLTNVSAKSFAITEHNLLKNIIEKRVISNHVCVGAYGFNSSNRFKNIYQQLAKITNQGELFISHIIKHDIDKNRQIYKSIVASEYIDCGTYNEFVRHAKNHSTIFTDIDGVVFMNQSEYFTNNYTIAPIIKPNAVNFLLKKQEEGATIIFVTSRNHKHKDITESALDNCGFKNYRVVYDLPHTPRLLINDVSTTNPWPSASAINVPRDDDNFWKSMI